MSANSNFYRLPKESAKEPSIEAGDLGGKRLLVQLSKVTRQQVEDSNFASSFERLQGDIETFFVDHEHFIHEHFEGEERQQRLDDLEESRPQLVKMVAKFSELYAGLDTPAIVFTSDEYQALAEIREDIDPAFLENLLDFYNQLEDSIRKIIDGVQFFGKDYFMAGPNSYNGDMVKSLGESFEHMKSTEDLMDQLLNLIERKSVLIRTIRKKLVEQAIEDYAPERIASAQGIIEETDYYNKEAQAMVDLVHEPELSLDEKKERVFEIIQMNLSHMSGALATQFLPGLSDEAFEAATTPKQMEFLFSMVNKCVRLLSNVYYIRDNLLVGQLSLEQQAPEEILAVS